MTDQPFDPETLLAYADIAYKRYVEAQHERDVAARELKEAQEAYLSATGWKWKPNIWWVHPDGDSAPYREDAIEIQRKKQA